MVEIAKSSFNRFFSRKSLLLCSIRYWLKLHIVVMHQTKVENLSGMVEIIHVEAVKESKYCA